jgi:hypothetical protein
MGFIYRSRSRYLRKCGENLLPHILTRPRYAIRHLAWPPRVLLQFVFCVSELSRGELCRCTAERPGAAAAPHEGRASGRQAMGASSIGLCTVEPARPIWRCARRPPPETRLHAQTPWWPARGWRTCGGVCNYQLCAGHHFQECLGVRPEMHVA